MNYAEYRFAMFLISSYYNITILPNSPRGIPFIAILADREFSLKLVFLTRRRTAPPIAVGGSVMGSQTETPILLLHI